MKTLYSRLPREGFTYDAISNFLISEEVDVCKVGNNTIAYFIDDPDDPDGARIGVRLHKTEVGVLFSSGSAVMLNHGNHKTRTTQDRLDRMTTPLGYRVSSVRGTWKIYSIQSGEYRDYKIGMIVERGRF